MDASEDTRLIERLISDCSYHLDMNEPEDVLTLFTDDCEVVYGPGDAFTFRGLEAYRAVLYSIAATFSATSHHNTNVVVDFDGPDAADVRSALISWQRVARDGRDGHFYGQYFDRVVRTDAGWRFARRELRAAGSIGMNARNYLAIGRRPTEKERDE